MTDHSSASPLFFPWNGVVPASETLLIRDIDVVGVGALRRAQIESIQSEKQIILQTHSAFIPESVRAIYDEELLRTLQWLRPLREEVVQKFDFNKEQKDVFIKIFPLTQKLLGLAADKVSSEYLQGMDWSSWLLQDHWRYFSGFVRQKFPNNNELRELVHWEWVLAWLEIQPFSSIYKEDVGTVVLNPSLQIVRLSKDHPVLQKPEGLYAFVYDPMQMRVVERRLDIHEAAILDLFGEDRKYSVEQIIDAAMLVEDLLSTLSRAEWQDKLRGLIDTHVLIHV